MSVLISVLFIHVQPTSYWLVNQQTPVISHTGEGCVRLFKFFKHMMSFYSLIVENRFLKAVILLLVDHEVLAFLQGVGLEHNVGVDDGPHVVETGP